MRGQAAALVVALAAVSAGTGCKKMRKHDSDAGSPIGARSGTLTPSWAGAEVSFAEVAAKGTFNFDGTRLTASFQNVAPGDSVTMGTDKASANASHYMSASTDLGARMAKLRPADAFDYRYKLDPETKVDLVLGGVHTTIDAPSGAVCYGLTNVFKKAIDAPLNLPLPDSKPVEHTILFVGGASSEVLGPAATVDAIDRVALTTSLPDRKGKPCEASKKAGESGKGEVLPLVMKDQRVTVYDVRDSRALATKDFKAEEKCPVLTFANKEPTSYASTEEEKAWLRELRATK